VIIVGGGLALVAVVGTAWWLHRPPPVTADASTLARYVSSPQFERLPAEQKKPYLEAMRRDLPKLMDDSSGLSDEDRFKAVDRTMGDPMGRALDEYSKLPEGPQREKYLDRMIDEQERIRREPPPPPSADGKGPQQVKFKRGPEAMESIPPDRRARMAELMGDLQRRREARGLGEAGGIIFRFKEPAKGPE
jgi:hypothetical protein